MKTAEELLTLATEKLFKTSDAIGGNLAHMSYDGVYKNENANPPWWTNGFWPGMLWLMYQKTKEEKYATYARECEARLDPVLHDFYRIDHDAGFIWFLSAGADYRLTGNEESKRRTLIAASFLASRFNAAGNYIRAWNNEDRQGWAIIDCMMNLPLLYWASRELDDPRFAHIAQKHADTVINCFIGADGHSSHIVKFNPETGEKVGEEGGQGYGLGSAWGRGNAWALYGFTLSYQYTGERRYFETAKRVAAYFIENLPADKVATADFKAPKDDPKNKKDSTAAAIAASGLALLSELAEDKEEKAYYMEQSLLMLQGLFDTCWAGDKDQALLLHGNVAYHVGQPLDDIPIIYGDYFYLEALMRHNGYQGLF